MHTRNSLSVKGILPNSSPAAADHQLHPHRAANGPFAAFDFDAGYRFFTCACLRLYCRTCLPITSSRGLSARGHCGGQVHARRRCGCCARLAALGNRCDAADVRRRPSLFAQRSLVCQKCCGAGRCFADDHCHSAWSLLCALVL